MPKIKTGIYQDIKHKLRAKIGKPAKLVRFECVQSTFKDDTQASKARNTSHQESCP